MMRLARGWKFNEAKANRSFASFMIAFVPVLASSGSAQMAENSKSSCHTESTEFGGWQAKQISNHWVKLILVPQLAGRLMSYAVNKRQYVAIAAGSDIICFGLPRNR